VAGRAHILRDLQFKPRLALPQWWAEPFVLPRVALPEWRAEPFLKGPQVKAVAGSAIRLRPTVEDEPLF